ncbi:hypothetical protein FOCC_FOCC004453 [Frankliniella occidentalis]|nr:hypothetical protein FOCC_FOCC004453 [Frankliniella occidentalis]
MTAAFYLFVRKMEGLEDDFTLLKSLIAITKGGLTVHKLLKEYREETGSSLNFSKYGFKDVIEMLRSCPEIAVTQDRDGVVCHVNDGKISHITSLVERTRDKKPRQRKRNYNKPRPSFCTSRSFYSPHRDSKHKSGGDTSSFKSANIRSVQYGPSSRNHENPNLSNYQRNCGNNVHYQGKGRVYSNSRDRTSSLNRGNQQIMHNRIPNAHNLHNGHPPKERDFKPVSNSTVSSSSSIKKELYARREEKSTSGISKTYSSGTEPAPSSKPINSEAGFHLDSGAVTSSSVSVSKSIPNLDDDWSSESESNQVPARTVLPSSRACYSSHSLQNNTVSSSRTKAQPVRSDARVCSFGARDVRYLSKTNESQKDDQKITPNAPPQSEAVGNVGHANPQSILRVVRPNNKTISQAEKKICLQTSLVSNQEIAVSGSPTKRVTSTSVKDGVPTIVVKVPNEKKAFTNCEPMYEDFQFIGDFLLLRVAEVCLASTVQRKGSISYCGLCRDNLTIAECEEAIVREGTTGKVVLCIGMTDIIQGASLEDMKKQTTSLLQRLKYNTVILITLPVPPSFIMIANEEKLRVLELYNRWLLNLRLPCLIDIDRHLYSDAPFYMRLPNSNVETFSEGGAWIVMDEIITALG